MSKATAIYVRVSHRDQSHASQLPDLERWTEAHDGNVQWFKDTFTGKTMNRPGMDNLMEHLRARGSSNGSLSGGLTDSAEQRGGFASCSTSFENARSIWSA